jgi:alkylhydroperoxidase/carboxymuconolactone decarboxylase family protein YurZ
VEQVDSACVGVLNSQGLVPHLLLTAARDAHYNVVPTIAPHAKQSAGNVDVASARAYFEGHFGSVPNFVELLAENSPPALEGLFLMRRATLMETPMPNKMMELLLCAVNAAEFQARFVAIHARGARRTGATEAELVEACLVALPLAGLASWWRQRRASSPLVMIANLRQVQSNAPSCILRFFQALSVAVSRTYEVVSLWLHCAAGRRLERGGLGNDPIFGLFNACMSSKYRHPSGSANCDGQQS